MKRILLSILFVIILVSAAVPLGLFVIGEPVDGDQLICNVQEDENTLHINISISSSAIALRGLRIRQEGSNHYITLRKVLVSPLYSSGSASVQIDMLKTDQVFLGGKLIWSSQ